MLRTAIEWGVLDEMPCQIRLLPAPKPAAHFHDFAAYEALFDAAKQTDWRAELIVLPGGEAGLRCGEMMALEWSDVDVRDRRLCVARSEWKGHVTTPKGNRVRYVPMTVRLAAALRDHRPLRSRRVLHQDDGAPLT
jgi:integrase